MPIDELKLAKMPGHPPDVRGDRADGGPIRSGRSPGWLARRSIRPRLAMKVLRVLRQCVLGLAVLSLAACSSDDETANDAQLKAQALQIVGQMSTRDKIGQKIMMAFRYWCEPPADPNCTDRMTVLPDAAASALRDHRIGGVVLFANNLVSVDQISRLTAQIAAAAPVGMLIGVDEEGGNVFRLPRGIATSFPGNMALGAAYLGAADAALAHDEGRVLASELAAVGMNVNFAPVVDVNSNPLNPVINVRAYGDDPAMVGLLGRHMARGMAHAGVISAFKHFPGHGDAATDSHYGLPRVDKSRADAYATDLAPYRASIDLGEAPEMIMTAHIQYPSLDETRVATRTGEGILVPATMSRKIQHDLLRGEFGYRGVTVSDALDMDAIANHFDPDQAVINLFRADVDIALMPVEFRTAGQADRLRAVIDRVVAALDAGTLSRAELDASVERITLMKLRHGIAPNASRPQTSAVTVIGSPGHRAAEQRIAQASITLLRNRGATLPLNAPQRPIFIMTPWGEQAQGMRQRFAELGYASVTGAKLAETPWAEQQRLIDAADIVILGTLSSAPSPVERNGDPRAADTRTNTASVQEGAAQPVGDKRPEAVAHGQRSLVFDVEGDAPTVPGVLRAQQVSAPSEAQRVRYAMEYAKAKGKTVIHVSLRAPYDVPSFDDVADATVATYSYYGYDNGAWRGPSMPALVDALAGVRSPLGRLPVSVYEVSMDGKLGSLRYARGFGMRY
ncbi:hydrolase [Ralstonia pseudosolanacearum]|uniref:beta-N-acetylhexosaminidase n=2 Tax=Ralstonia solanacearum species complex TaxID=3116862 RepID=Q8Y1C1_RALN1|nr:hydrolase [Ralstonia pseudosolanacearum]CAD14299.1 putative hydrolase glycosidase protein [Ralstonia pseudosolanacearum GMI1000]